MALDTYDGLKAEIADWLNRGNLTANIPTFIALFEARMNRELRVREMETRSTATLSDQFLALPTGFLSMKQLQLNASITAPLLFVSATELDNERKRCADVAGQPRIFSIIGSEIEVAPAPDASYEIEMVYHTKIPALAADNQTNWVLESHPDLYLYGSLLQSAPFVQEDERIELWASLVNKTMEEVRLADERARAGNSPLRARIRPYGS